MPQVKQTPQERIDALMEQGSKALVQRKYFLAERLCFEALGHAHQQADYERMARILLPLQEARRQKRDMAIDSGHVVVLDGQMPLPGEIRPGLYLIQPPRVGLDGKLLREAADNAEIPIIIVVREPLTKTGLCPVVALGPVTTRARITPPDLVEAEDKTTKGKKPVKKKPQLAQPGLPSVTWMLAANEALGDASIAEVDPTRPAAARVDELFLRLQGHADHEKLHQALMEACRAAIREGSSGIKKKAFLDQEALEALEDEAAAAADDEP